MGELTQYLLICLAALLSSGLTLFSGFGLGTLLLPVFALFFPVDVAIALTAVVHLLNNLFKLALLGRHADWRTLLAFGLPAIIAALAGAYALVWLSGLQAIMTYSVLNKSFRITPVKLIIGVLIIAFAIVELATTVRKWQLNTRYLPLGGVLSGFFGGLSGHQGALRAAFLIRAGLSKEALIATGVVIACVVDLARLAVYAAELPWTALSENAGLLAAAVLSAFAGALIGRRLLGKVTFRTVQVTVGVMLVLLGAALAAGLI